MMGSTLAVAARGALLAGTFALSGMAGGCDAASDDAASGSPPPARAATIARSGAIAGSGRPASADPKPSSANSAAHKATRKIKPREAPAAAKPPGPAYVQCDANIRVRAATTTCSFAQNVFYGYWVAGDSFSAYSPATRQAYAMSCDEGSTIVCRAGDGGEVRFAARAVELYSQSQADAYVASHDLGPDGDAVDGNADDRAYDDEIYADEVDEDDGYDDGDDVTEPGENIPYYDEGRGYRVECEDGTYSQSGGIQGACSSHGGVL